MKFLSCAGRLGPWLPMAVALALTVSGAEPTAPAKAADSRAAQRDLGLPVRGIAAHRGGAATHPENTLPALREAVRLGAHMIEIDLAVTRDGVPVLMHDLTVDRTTDGRGPVNAFTLEELRRLDAGKWKAPEFAGTRVPTLAEALAVLPRHVWINLDFKADARFSGRSAEVAQQVVRLLDAEGRVGQVLFAARGADGAAARAVAPGLRICNMDRKPDPADYVRGAIAARADFIQLRDCARDPRLPEWIAALKAAGVRINYYYANDPAEAARLLALGVDFVLADAVGAVLAGQTDLAPWPASRP